MPVVGTALVLYCGTVEVRSGPTRALSVRPLQAIGLISYSLYLVHWPLLIVPEIALGDGAGLPVWTKILLGIVVAVPVAGLLYRFVEQPLRNPRVLMVRPPRLTLFATALVTAVLAVSVTLAIPWAAGRTMSSGAAAPAPPAAPATPPTGTSFVPTNLRPALADVARDVPEVYDRPGCHLDVEATEVQDCTFGRPDGSFRVALFGDSHAGQWLPALQQIADDDRDLAINTYTKSSCPAVDVTVLVRNVAYTACDTWRAAVVARLVADPVDLVVISGYAYHPLVGEPEGSERRQQWADGLSRTVEQLRSAGSRVLIVADTPRFATAPPTCLSTHVRAAEECAGVPDVVLDADLLAAERSAAKSSGASHLDMTPYLCQTTSCPAIVGDLLVYRDVNHLTATFARYLAPVLRKPIEGAR